MRDRYLITITDYRGSRHYTLTQLMRHFLAAAFALLAVVMLAGSLVIHVLNGKVDRLKTDLKAMRHLHAAIEAENHGLLREQARLHADVEQKARTLLAVGDDLEHIEILIGLRSAPELPLARRVNTAIQTANEKRLMLESIPSGYPVASSRVTSGYGVRRHPVREGRAMHGGVDLHAPRGTAVHATADGVVEFAARHQDSGLGNMVKVVHNYGFNTIYAHLDRIEVSVGDYVRKGQLIAYSGSTGMTNGPHLHYEVRYLQRRLDPRPFMDWSLEKYDLVFTEEERVQWDSLAEAVRNTTSVMERPSSQQAHTWSATLH